MVMLGRAPAASGTNNQPRSVTPPSTVNPTSCRCTITPPPANTQNPQSAQPNVARRPAGTSGRHTERHQRVGTGHGDHWFGTDLLLQRFPGAIAYATEGTIAMMHKQATAGRAERWDVDFPGLIPDSPVVYRPIPPEGFELERHRLVAIETGHTDTDDTTVLHVPSIGLVVAGDVAYNGVHQYLLESAGGGITAWLNALDRVAALRPRAVVAGHKNKDLPDDPAILEQTRDYLLDARRLLAVKPSPREFYDQMIERYPDRLNVGPVWYGALGLLS
jgi:glyoxylase-like metal-dependent hydrolase (beta-lactamase superfamily II)